MKTNWRSGGTAPHSLNLCTRWMSVDQNTDGRKRYSCEASHRFLYHQQHNSGNMKWKNPRELLRKISTNLHLIINLDINNSANSVTKQDDAKLHHTEHTKQNVLTVLRRELEYKKCR